MSATLVSDILAGNATAASAIGRPDLYAPLMAGKNGVLPILGSSRKIEAGLAYGVDSAVVYMMPAMSSGRNACPGASDGCIDVCLVVSGQMGHMNAVVARRRKQAAFFADRNAFFCQLYGEVKSRAANAVKNGKIPAYRVNGVTDWTYWRMPFTLDGVSYPSIVHALPDVQFYEYTKKRLSAQGAIPSNLHLTFSYSERPDADERAAEYLQAGHNVAVVTFGKKHDIPAEWTIGGVSYPTVDGDLHDARFLDPKGHVVILAAKGRATTDTSGFVQKVA